MCSNNPAVFKAKNAAQKAIATGTRISAPTAEVLLLIAKIRLMFDELE